MRSLVRVGVVLAGFALAACGSSPEPTPSQSPSESPSPTASATPSACEPEGSTDEQQSSDPLAMSSLGGVAMRVGQHECFERFVFELGGEGDPPGWTVGYRDPLTQDGSGAPVDLVGGADLEVVVRAWTVLDPANSPAPELPPFEGPTDLRPDGFEAIAQAKFIGAFEGVTQLGIGLDQQRPFRAYWLDDPGRLVVDVYVAGDAS